MHLSSEEVLETIVTLIICSATLSIMVFIFLNFGTDALTSWQ